MLLETGLVKVALLATLENAVKLLTLYLVAVDLLMLLQVGARAELLIAEFALEWLFSRVDPLVSDQVRNLGEGLLAAMHVALEGSQFIVDSSMFLQRGKLCETLITYVTKHIDKIFNQFLSDNKKNKLGHLGLNCG